MTALRTIGVLVVTGLLAAACGGSPAETTSTTAVVSWDAAADQFAYEARLALEGTRFEALGDQWLSDLVVEVCEQLGAGADPDQTIAGAVGGVDAPAGDPADDEILSEVLTAGAADVCPDAVVVAAGLDPSGGEATAFLSLVSPAVTGAGFTGSLDEVTLLRSGLAVCHTLDGGGSAEEAAVVALSELFGVAAPDLSGMEEAGLGQREGTVAGAVLGAAVAAICPEHADTVAGYVGGNTG